MAKVVNCRDIGFDCDGVIRAETEEAVLKLVAEHAKDVHNLETVSEEVVAKVRKVMRDE
jgi:predicted small metal-binding protein